MTVDEVGKPEVPKANAESLLEIVGQAARELAPSSKGPRKVRLDSRLDRDLGFDSLGRVELITRLEDHFGVGLPESVLAAADTPRDLLRALKTAGAPISFASPVELGEGPPQEVAAAPDRCRTLVEVVEWHVEHHADRRCIVFLPGDGPPEEMTHGDLYRRSLAVAAGLQERGLEPAQSVGLMLPTSLEYFTAFLGVILAGGTPVPLYPPARPSQIEDHLRRQAGILSTALARFLITWSEVRPLARLVKARVKTLESVVTVDEITAEAVEPRLPRLKEDNTAFLQFTSGSTAEPKGVILTHANLLSNLRTIGRAVGLSPADVCASWLPLYHDMGLIGAWMGTLYYAVPLFLMSPVSFLLRPARWLWTVHHQKATVSAAPNFAYELCLAKIRDEEIEGLDLSSWRATLNGAEPVSAQTIRRFTERFARYGLRRNAVMPVYGLAECSLGLAFPPVGREIVVDRVKREPLMRSGRAKPAEPEETDALEFVGCGPVLPGHEIRVVDAAGSEVGEREEGRLEFRGPSATSGYFRNPEATRRLFRGDWLDSGDLAYIVGGEVFITGREKDMIIRAGQNIYPQELEQAVGAVHGIRKGCVAVFGSPDPASGTERLVIMAETRESDPEARERLTEEIQSVAVDLVGTPVDDVVLAPPRTVPKTSSGKLRRTACRDIYEQGRPSRARAPWWQVTRFAFAGARAQAARSARAAGSVLYAGRFWGTVAVATVPVVLVITLLPKLRRRRQAAREAARQVARLTSTAIRVDGLENLSGEGPWIVAANHASYLDGFALTALLPVEGAFLAKRELEQSFLARLLLSRLGTLFVERFDPNRGLEDIQRAVETIRAGESLLFFPEGTFDRAPGLRSFRLGAFFVAAETGVPIVPVAIRGTRSMLRGREWFPRRGSIAVTIRPPIHPKGSDWSAAVELRDEVRAEILKYCGEVDLA
jgi:1-acyl-sn-glycerol-3-phosphate acyltransferase